MRALKIALLSRWYAEETRRFGEKGGTLRQLAEAVAALGHEVVVLSQSAEAKTLEKAQIGALEVWLSPREKRRDFLTGLRDKWAKQSYGHRKVHSDALALRDFLAQRGPFDLLWAHGEEPDGLVAAIAAQRGVAVPPTVVQIQALRYRFEKGVPIFNEKAALGLAFRHAARILANSEMIARTLPEYAGPGLTAAQMVVKTRVVYPNLGRDFLKSAEEISPAPVVTSTSPRVLFFGALNEGKGALVFLEALAKTEAAKRGASFAMIGDFTEKNAEFEKRWKEAVEAAKELLAAGQLHLWGKLSPFDVMREIKLASVVVLPSLFDAFSRALVESLVLGRPVVTTDRVGAAKLVEEHACGVVVAAADAVALARGIDAVLDPAAPYAANAGQMAHRLLHEFSPEAIARQLVRQFAEVVG